MSPSRLIPAALLTLALLVTNVLPLAAEVVDLAKLEKAGLPESVRERMVIMSLSQRARPPLTGDFLLAMNRYGGESLTLKYMSLDAATASEKTPRLSPEVVSRLMSSGVPRADIEAIIESAERKTPESLQPVPVPVALQPVSEVTVEDINDQKTGPLSAPTPPKAPESYQTLKPYSPNDAYEAPERVLPPTKAELRKIPQTLYPGQPADPARPLPPQPGPYHIRKPQGDNGVFMGVMEEVKPDGHVYQVNSNGRKNRAGFEVQSRPSGHKVYRYFSGRTDRTRPAPAPAPAPENYDYYGDEDN